MSSARGVDQAITSNGSSPPADAGGLAYFAARRRRAQARSLPGRFSGVRCPPVEWIGSSVEPRQRAKPPSVGPDEIPARKRSAAGGVREDNAIVGQPRVG